MYGKKETFIAFIINAGLKHRFHIHLLSAVINIIGKSPILYEHWREHNALASYISRASYDVVATTAVVHI